MMTSCRIQFTSDFSIFTQEVSVNKEQFKHWFPPLDGRKGEKKERNKEITAQMKENYSTDEKCLI